jgi:hypothetical protein
MRSHRDEDKCRPYEDRGLLQPVSPGHFYAPASAMRRRASDRLIYLGAISQNEKRKMKNE